MVVGICHANAALSNGEASNGHPTVKQLDTIGPTGIGRSDLEVRLKPRF